MLAAALLVAIAIAALFVFTRYNVRRIERLYPPRGEMLDIGGSRLHVVHRPGPDDPDLPPIVFIHGASGNLCDPMTAFMDKLEGRTELLFVDRPGHGWSERGGEAHHRLESQARAVAALLERKNIERAIVVGHSFGGAIALSMALETPNRVSGLLLLSAVSHPWPGGIDWHYNVTATPVLGHIFAALIAMPAGLVRMPGAARCVFLPNAMPADYLQRAATALVLRPKTFRNNALDVSRLFDHVTRTAPRYGHIAAPTVVMTGDRDDVVSPDIHSAALARDIAGAQLLRIRGVGHKPDFGANDLCISAIEKISGKQVDLAGEAARLQQRLTGTDRFPDTTNPAHGKADPAGQIPLMPSDPI